MTKDRYTYLIAAILTTLAETLKPDESCAASTLYLALGMDLGLWESIADTLTHCGWVTIKGHQVTLTEKGYARGSAILAVTWARKEGDLNTTDNGGR